MKCKYCSSDFDESSYFCPSCGRMTDNDLFTDEEIIKKYEQKMLEAINSVMHGEHINIAWDTTANKYVRTLEKLSAILNLEEFKNGSEKDFIRRIDSFKKRCEKPEFHIAFVGTIKAGKSTLINALLGKNYASTSVTPETAVLTKFKHSDNNYVNVKFYSKDEWDLLWKSVSNNADIFLQEYKKLNGDAEKNKWINKPEIHNVVSADDLENEIEKWTSSKKAEHYFVKEVEIGLKDFNMPPEVVFVDTPGLDDAVRYRSDVTRAYIDRANAVFACVKSDALTGPELNTIYRIFSNTSYNPEKVYIIGTQWDSLNKPKEDWKLQKEEWVKYLSRKDAYCSKELAEKNITYTAAYLNNLARDYESLNDDDIWNLKSLCFKFRINSDKLESSLKELITMSNIDEIRRKIEQDIVSKHKEYLYKDIEQVYLDIRNDLNKYFKEITKNQNDIILTSKKSIEEIRQDYEKAKAELEEVQMYKKQLVETLNLVKKDTDDRINNLSKQLKEIIKR